ncbi:MAG: hypothetical protein J3K34DRAFT_413013 [Monoraphidium minutum]|nr:MAG: hypothetical protein J3K34DRAFT_413013 [Monoraphidium minutum]
MVPRRAPACGARPRQRRARRGGRRVPQASQVPALLARVGARGWGGGGGSDAGARLLRGGAGPSAAAHMHPSQAPAPAAARPRFYALAVEVRVGGRGGVGGRGWASRGGVARGRGPRAVCFGQGDRQSDPKGQVIGSKNRGRAPPARAHTRPWGQGARARGCGHHQRSGSQGWNQRSSMPFAQTGGAAWRHKSAGK